MSSSSITRTLTTATKRWTAALAATLTSNPALRPASPFAASTSHPFSVVSTEAASPISSQSPEMQRSRWSKWMLFLPGAITFGLGSWQIVRRQEKMKMLEYRQQRLAADPVNVSATTTSNESIDDTLEFRRVLCRGVFDETKSVFVGPRSRSISGVTENGYYLITPLVPISDDPDSVRTPILVNRGWVPRSWRDKSIDAAAAAHSAQQPSDTVSVSKEKQDGDTSWRFWSKKQQTVKDQLPDIPSVEVIGVIRGSEKPSIFVPPNDPNSFQWFYVDVPAIARACGLPETTLYIEDIHDNVNPANPYPIPKDADTLIRSSVMPQDHLNYTITWYSLSAAVTYMAFKRIKPRKIHPKIARTR